LDEERQNYPRNSLPEINKDKCILSKSLSFSDFDKVRESYCLDLFGGVVKPKLDWVGIPKFLN